jgi:hypothetical protein
MNKNNNLYWIGPRRSDIWGIEDIFAGAVTIFGEDSKTNSFYCESFSNKFKIRIDHNDHKHDNSINDFFRRELDEIIKINPNAKFVWYRGIPPDLVTRNVKEQSICTNSSLLINYFLDKLRSRLIISDFIPVLPGTLRFVHECSYNKLINVFSEANQFVLQETYDTYGGFGTHLLNKKNEKVIITKLGKRIDCLVSPYFENSIPINQHLVIYETQIITFAPSIQIIQNINDKLIYSGGDYAALKFLSNKIRKQINHYSKIVGEILQKLGYRGVLGIDYLLLPEERLVFVEMNTRFQGSTLALNQSLINNKCPSVQEYHIESFKSRKCKLIPNFDIANYSTISNIYTEDNSYSLFMRNLLNNNVSANIDFLDDGLKSAETIDNGAYLYRILLKTNLVSPNFEHGLNFHPIPFHRPFKSLSFEKCKEKLALFKFNLITNGIRMGESIDKKKKLSIKNNNAVGSALDLVFDDYIHINAPLTCKFVEFSPFSLEWDLNNGYWISYLNKFIHNVKVSPIDKPSRLKTTRGVLFNDIAQFYTDRLRINPFPNCCNNKKNELACKFCDLGNSNKVLNYEINDVFEVVEGYLQSGLKINHILVGGGSSIQKNSWSQILKLVQFIRKITNKRIYLMVLPPKDLKILGSLYQVGVSEIGFNIEIYNRNIAKELMPFKGNIQLNQYYKAFDVATKLWGKKGNVRSIFILGLEPEKNVLEGVEEICKRGVMPILSTFRPLPETPLVDYVPPTSEFLYSIWGKTLNISKKYGLIPGPLCVPCQNNTISIPPEYC